MSMNKPTREPVKSIHRTTNWNAMALFRSSKKSVKLVTTWRK